MAFITINVPMFEHAKLLMKKIKEVIYSLSNENYCIYKQTIIV